MFYADECLGRRLPIALREAGLRVEVHQDHFAGDTEDTAWLPVVGARGWVVLTKDKAMKRRPAELHAIKVSKVKMFALSKGNHTGDEMAELFISNLRNMGRTLKNYEAPFIARLSKNGLEVIELGSEGE